MADREGYISVASLLTQLVGAEFFGAMFESAPDALVIVDSEARIVLVNRRAELLFGYRREELLGEWIELLLPEKYRGAHRDHRNRFLREPSVRTTAYGLDLFARGKDGVEFPVDVILSPVESKVGLLVLTSIRDISDRKRAEEERRANEAKTVFLSRASHELRTPLNAILGFAQLLEIEAGDNARFAEGVEQILKAGRHLLNLVNEVLEVSRIEAGQLQISLEPVVVTRAIGDAVELMAPLAAERSVSLVSELGDMGGVHVVADRQRLAQILLNLLSNAIKYSPDKGTVVIGAERVAPQKVRLFVRDNGPGISPELMGRLFTPFDRLGESDPLLPGTGLGLALSRGLASAMDGQLGVDTIPGEGSTFWVELDRTDEPGAEGRPDDVASAWALLNASRFGRPFTVLYVEDNLSSLRLVERILDGAPGVRLLSAMQGRLGLDLARKHAPDIVLLDLHLPDIPGREVLRRLRLDPHTSGIPVVILSADATPEQITLLLAEGAVAYLTKPIDVRQFIGAIENVIREAAPR